MGMGCAGGFRHDPGPPHPGPDTVRNRPLRPEYHPPHRPIPRRDDWVIFLDQTMVLGSSRRLLVLGTSLRRWQARPGALAHSEMQALPVGVVTRSSGIVVRDRSRRLFRRIGVPARIVGDHGTDLTKKGSRRTPPSTPSRYRGKGPRRPIIGVRGYPASKMVNGQWVMINQRSGMRCGSGGVSRESLTHQPSFIFRDPLQIQGTSYRMDSEPPRPGDAVSGGRPIA